MRKRVEGGIFTLRLLNIGKSFGKTKKARNAVTPNVAIRMTAG